MATTARKIPLRVINPQAPAFAGRTASYAFLAGKIAYLRKGDKENRFGLGFLFCGVPLIIKKSGKPDWKTFHIYATCEDMLYFRKYNPLKVWGLLEQAIPSDEWKLFGGNPVSTEEMEMQREKFIESLK